jgi:hypothetical protein
LQHGPTTSDVDRHNTKKKQSPHEIQKHGLESNNTRRSTSKKAQHGAKRHVKIKDSSQESSSKGTKNSKELSSSETSSPLHGIRKRRKSVKGFDPEEFKKSKPPTLDGHIKKGEEAKSWLLGLKKYFKVHDYYEKVKARIAIFNFNGKASIWWEYLRNVKGIHEKEFSWRRFEKYFKKTYLSERYYDENTKEFYELKLVQLTIDEYVNKLLELMRYVAYIKDEKTKIQRFISGLPQSFRDRIDFDEPKTLEDTIRKARYCYEHFKHEAEPHKDRKKEIKLVFKKKGFKPSRFNNHGKGSKMSLPTKSLYQKKFPSQSGNKPLGSAPGKTDNTKREPLKFRGCGEEYLLREYPHRQQENRRVYNIQEATRVNYVARSVPQIYVALDNRQADHQSSAVEMEGMITNYLVSILIDLGSNLSYVAPRTIEKCKLEPIKHAKSWLVQLATIKNIKVT